MCATFLPMPFNLDDFLRCALKEDIGTGDLSVRALKDPSRRVMAGFLAKEDGVLAGGVLVEPLFRLLPGDTRVELLEKDGGTLTQGTVFGEVEGPVAALLAGERTCLNLLQQLSGVATLTRKFVEAVSGLPVRITDTRKTVPGLRALQKYAVKVGGGSNHRMGLYDAVMLKDNHLDAGDGIAAEIRRVRQAIPHTMTIELETRNLQEVREALDGGADSILLDNMDLATMREAVALCRKVRPVILEASGGVNLETVRGIAETGVDVISVGALTHSAPALDLSMKFAKHD